VGNCVSCHTKIDMRTGALAGPLFGGGAVHESHTDPTQKFVTPNLTPHPRWGWIASWPEEVFVARVHMGKQREGTPMPWHAFKGMHDDDLRAIFRYLRTLPPAEGGPDPGMKDAVVALRN
jgi:mono/diheme cytochrome c family protein